MTKHNHTQSSLTNDAQNDIEDKREERETEDERELVDRRYGKGKFYARRPTSRGSKEPALEAEYQTQAKATSL